MMRIARCTLWADHMEDPMHGKFYGMATVAQGWQLDETGEFEDTIEVCSDVYKHPRSNEESWSCAVDGCQGEVEFVVTPESGDLTKAVDPADELEEQTRLAGAWEETARFHARNEAFYRGLLEQTAEHLGVEVRRCDDGSLAEDPLVLKIPDMVKALAKATEPPEEPPIG